MPRSIEKAQRDSAKFDLLAVVDRSETELGVGPGAEDNVSAGSVRKLSVPAHEVGVEMGLDYVFDLEALSLGFGNVLIDVALRINYCRFAFGGDHIRRVR